jgi:23S rRNA maturation-related 3'-5' exoribonuclease YhaM
MFFVLISAVYLRRTENCEFYKFRTSQVKTIRLKQQLWQKQLQLENSISPTAVSKVVKENVKKSN